MSYQTHPRTPSYSTLEYQIKLYGHEEGHRRYTEICKKKKEGSQTSLIYWLNLGYSQEEAIELRKQRQQTFSLQKCITMYGEDLGKQKFKERQIKWQNTLQSKTEEEKRVINIKKNSFSVEGWMLKGYTQEEDTNIINKKLYNCHIPRYSQEALIFFETNFDPTGWLYGNAEWYIWDEINKKHLYYDFTNITKKIIIEYHGYAFHPNKQILSEIEWNNWTHPYSNKTADEIALFDAYKKNIAEKQGFKVFEIFSNTPQNEIQKTVNYILNEYIL